MKVVENTAIFLKITFLLAVSLLQNSDYVKIGRNWIFTLFGTTKFLEISLFSALTILLVETKGIKCIRLVKDMEEVRK